MSSALLVCIGFSFGWLLAILLGVFHDLYRERRKREYAELARPGCRRCAGNLPCATHGMRPEHPGSYRDPAPVPCPHPSYVEATGWRVCVWCPRCGDRIPTVKPTQVRRETPWPADRPWPSAQDIEPSHRVGGERPIRQPPPGRIEKRVRKGGVNAPPDRPRPNITPPGQGPPGGRLSTRPVVDGEPARHMWRADVCGPCARVCLPDDAMDELRAGRGVVVEYRGKVSKP